LIDEQPRVAQAISSPISLTNWRGRGGNDPAACLVFFTWALGSIQIADFGLNGPD